MSHFKPLPPYLVNRYRGWKATQFEENKAWFKHLASEGQHPRSMVISCCDSRVHVTSIFGAETGEFFIHRNIANLVPPFNPSGDFHGTSAAIEYAVEVLKVSHIIVMGHSNCGGVNGFHSLSTGPVSKYEQESSFVGKWIEILRPGLEQAKDLPDQAQQIRALEYAGVKISLENLMTFPFIRDAVNAESLTLHGLWHDIGVGGLEYFDSKSNKFVQI